MFLRLRVLSELVGKFVFEALSNPVVDPLRIVSIISIFREGGCAGVTGWCCWIVG